MKEFVVNAKLFCKAWNLQLELLRRTKALNSQLDQNRDLMDLYDQSQLEARHAQRMVEIILSFSDNVQRKATVLSLQESLKQRDSRIADLEKNLEDVHEQIRALRSAGNSITETSDIRL